MKISRRLTIKGDIDYDNRVITCYDKELGEQEYNFDDIFVQFNGLEGVTLTLAHDTLVEAE